MIGSFLVGLLAAVTLERVMVSANLRAAVLIGFCGGFTTYSAFAWETLVLARDGNPIGAVANIAAQIVLGLAAVWAGYTVALKF